MSLTFYEWVLFSKPSNQHMSYTTWNKFTSNVNKLDLVGIFPLIGNGLPNSWIQQKGEDHVIWKIQKKKNTGSFGTSRHYFETSGPVHRFTETPPSAGFLLFTPLPHWSEPKKWVQQGPECKWDGVCNSVSLLQWTTKTMDLKNRRE